jgi:protein SCO1/2
MRQRRGPRQTVIQGKTLAYGIAAVVALVLGGLAGALLLQPQQLQMQTATVLPAPRALPPLALVDQDGKPFTTASLHGHWTLLFAGYTYCPDVCPTTLALLKQLSAALPGNARPQVVFLSVDPDRDTPARLKQYVQYFDPAFVGVTAHEPALAAAAQAFGIAYSRVPGPTAEQYDMEHSAALILVDPDAAIRAYFSPPHTLEALKSDLTQLMEHRA